MDWQLIIVTLAILFALFHFLRGAYRLFVTRQRSGRACAGCTTANKKEFVKISGISRPGS